MGKKLMVRTNVSTHDMSCFPRLQLTAELDIIPCDAYAQGEYIEDKFIIDDVSLSQFLTLILILILCVQELHAQLIERLAPRTKLFVS